MDTLATCTQCGRPVHIPSKATISYRCRCGGLIIPRRHEFPPSEEGLAPFDFDLAELGTEWLEDLYALSCRFDTLDDFSAKELRLYA